jgi:hypothetical protein
LVVSRGFSGVHSPWKGGRTPEIVAAGVAATMSKLMDKRTLQKWIREANAAAALASETALAGERRASKAKQSARKMETRIKIQLGAEALRLAKGVISQMAFEGRAADAVREIDEINQALCAAGLKRRNDKDVNADQNAPSMPLERIIEPSEMSAKVTKIEVGFASVPPDKLRDTLKETLRFRYDRDSRTWRGRAIPKNVADEIRDNEAEGLVRIFLVDGRTLDLPVRG